MVYFLQKKALQGLKSHFLASRLLATCWLLQKPAKPILLASSKCSAPAWSSGWYMVALCWQPPCRLHDF